MAGLKGRNIPKIVWPLGPAGPVAQAELREHKQCGAACTCTALKCKEQQQHYCKDFTHNIHAHEKLLNRLESCDRMNGIHYYRFVYSFLIGSIRMYVTYVCRICPAVIAAPRGTRKLGDLRSPPIFRLLLPSPKPVGMTPTAGLVYRPACIWSYLDCCSPRPETSWDAPNRGAWGYRPA